MPDEQKVETTSTGENQTTTQAEGDAVKQAAKPPSLDELQAELERTKAALKGANNESASRRKKLDEYEAKEKKAQEANLSEVEKLKAQIAESQAAREQMLQELAQTRLRHAVEREAAKLKFKNPDDAYLLADLTGVEMDDDGKIKGVDTALATLLKARPYLVEMEEKKPTPPNANGTNQQGKPDEQARLKSVAQRFGIKGV